MTNGEKHFQQMACLNIDLMYFKNEKELQETLMQFLHYQGYCCNKEVPTKGGGRLDILAQKNSAPQKTLIIECKHILDAPSIKSARLQINDYFISYPSAERVISGLSIHKKKKSSQETIKKASRALRKVEDQGIRYILLDKDVEFISWYDNIISGKQSRNSEKYHSLPVDSRQSKKYYAVDPKHRVEFIFPSKDEEAKAKVSLLQTSTQNYTVDPKHRIDFFFSPKDNEFETKVPPLRTSVQNEKLEHKEVTSTQEITPREVIDTNSKCSYQSDQAASQPKCKSHANKSKSQNGPNSGLDFFQPGRGLILITASAFLGFVIAASLPQNESIIIVPENEERKTEKYDASYSEVGESLSAQRKEDGESSLHVTPNEVTGNQIEKKWEHKLLPRTQDNSDSRDMYSPERDNTRSFSEADTISNLAMQDSTATSLSVKEEIYTENLLSGHKKSYFQPLPGVLLQEVQDGNSNRLNNREFSSNASKSKKESLLQQEHTELSSTNGFATNFPMNSCGDKDIESNILRYQVHIPVGDLEFIKKTYCKDAFYKSNGQIQIASFQNES